MFLSYSTPPAERGNAASRPPSLPSHSLQMKRSSAGGGSLHPGSEAASSRGFPVLRPIPPRCDLRLPLVPDPPHFLTLPCGILIVAIIVMPAQGVCVFLLCGSPKQETPWFPPAFPSQVALSRSEGGRLQRCHFYFAKDNWQNNISTPFRTSPDPTGQGSGAAPVMLQVSARRLS